MGEYADLQIRADIKRMTGVDPGDMSDDDRPTKKFVKPVYKRVKCPHCDAKPKEAGLRGHCARPARQHHEQARMQA